MTIDKTQLTINVYNRLKPISRKISALDCKSCNGEISEQDYDIKIDKLLAQAKELASDLGLKVYHQSDPRGCSLYLVDKTMNDGNYNRGVAII